MQTAAFIPTQVQDQLDVDPTGIGANSTLVFDGTVFVPLDFAFSNLAGQISLDQLPIGTIVTLDDPGADALYFFNETTGMPELITAAAAATFVGVDDVNQRIDALTFDNLSGTIRVDQFPPGTVVTLDSIDEDAVYFFDNALFAPRLVGATELATFVGVDAVNLRIDNLVFSDIGGTLSLDQLPPGTVVSLETLGEDALYFFDDSLSEPRLINAADAATFVGVDAVNERIDALTFDNISGTIRIDQFPPGTVVTLESIDEDGVYFFDNTLFAPKLLGHDDFVTWLGITGGGGSIASTTTFLMGNGAGAAIASNLEDDGTGDLNYTFTQNNQDNISVVNHNNGTFAGCGFSLETGTTGEVDFVMGAYAPGHDATGILLGGDGWLWHTGRIVIGAVGPILFANDGVITERARINNGLSVGSTTDPGAGNILLGGLTASVFVKTDASKILVSKTASEMRTDLSLVIGTDVQAHDADLDTIAGLTATTDNFIVSVSSAWASRTPAQVRTTLGLVIGTNVQAYDADLAAVAALTTDSFGLALLTKTSASSIRTYIGCGTSSFDGAFSSLTGTPTTLSGYGITDAQPLDSDLTAIAGLTATTDNFIVSVSSAWASRTPAQVKTTLALVIGTNVQAWDTDLDSWAAITRASGFDTFVATPTSANLASLITNETGSGALVFGTSPTFTTQAIFNGYLDFQPISTPADPTSTTIRFWTETSNGFGLLAFKDANALVYQLGRDNITTVRNTTGSTITKGQWVYISGSTGTVPNIALAKADSATTMPVMGVVVASISNNSFGQIMTLGDVQGLDTSGFSAGDVLFISAATAGAVSTTRATGSSLDQRVGVVVKSNATTGIIAVQIGGEFNPATTQTLTNKTLTSPKINENVALTSTATQLNYVNGVTSAIQTQLDGKQPLDSDLTTIAGLTATTDNFIVSVSSAWASRTPTQVKSTLGLVIGTNVQAWDADLDTLAGLTATTDNFIVSVSSAWASRTPTQVKSTLGLVIGTNVQAWDADLDTIAGLTATTDNFLVSVSSAWASRTPAQVRTTLGLVIGTNVEAWSATLDSWAGKTVPTGTVVGDTDTQTLTNKTIDGTSNTLTKVVHTVAVGASDFTDSTTSFVDVTGLSFAVAANKNYMMQFFLMTNKSAGAAGIKFRFTGPASPTNVGIRINSVTSSLSTTTADYLTAFSSATAAYNTFAGDAFVIGSAASIVNGANAGTVQLQLQSQTSGTAKVYAGSWLSYTLLN